MSELVMTLLPSSGSLSHQIMILGLALASYQEQAAEIELLPVTRRDCSVDVVMGNHQYYTKGTYLLKFDNSYSLLRSKDVYYRVYYHKPTS